MRGLVRNAALGIALLLLARGAAFAQAEPNPEQDGAREGQTEGRVRGLEAGRDEGRAQAMSEAWFRGFQRGVGQSSTWRRDTSWDEGVAEGERPGRASGLVAGQARGRDACAAAFLRLQGRPSLVTEPAPPAPEPPPPPRHPTCDEPAPLTLRFPGDRSVQVRLQDCEHGRSPLGWDVPRPDYPDGSSLRDRARMDGYEDDALEAWIRGYKTSFKEEFTEAFRTMRDTAPASLVRQWEEDGESEGRREGRRRSACEDFGRGFETGWRDGFEAGFERGFVEAWEAEEQAHLDHAVVRILDARLLDASGDGVIEPGEGVRAELDVANAGLRDADGDVLAYEGAVTLAGRGTLAAPLRAQSRRRDVVELGRADDGAPFGAGIDVRLRGEHGDARALTGVVGRPVILERAEASLDVRDGALVTRVLAHVASVAERDADRALAVAAQDRVVPLGVVRARDARTVELELPAAASALAETTTGSVELRSGEARWMLREWTHDPRFGDSLLTAARLPAGSPQLDEALTTLSRRLHAELGRALDDPKLYARLDDGSDLAELARVRTSLPAATRADVEARLVRPLTEAAEAKGTPRKVRRAVREALGGGVGSR